jgi:hypothetical protein
MKRTTGVIAAIALALIFTGGQEALAGLDVDLGARVRVGDDTDLFVNISSRYFKQDSRVVADLGVRYGNPDDLAVALFLSNRTGKHPDSIWRLRQGGLSWYEIGLRYRVPVDAWFITTERRPGPPYGKAYGHWKNGKNSNYRLTDADARNLVAVRMIHEYYGVSVDVAMDRRATGRSVKALVNHEYRQRHAQVASSKTGGKPGKGNGRKK